MIVEELYDESLALRSMRKDAQSRMFAQRGMSNYRRNENSSLDRHLSDHFNHHLNNLFKKDADVGSVQHFVGHALNHANQLGSGLSFRPFANVGTNTEFEALQTRNAPVGRGFDDVMVSSNAPDRAWEPKEFRRLDQPPTLPSYKESAHDRTRRWVEETSVHDQEAFSGLPPSPPVYNPRDSWISTNRGIKFDSVNPMKPPVPSHRNGYVETDNSFHFIKCCCGQGHIAPMKPPTRKPPPIPSYGVNKRYETWV